MADMHEIQMAEHKRRHSMFKDRNGVSYGFGNKTSVKRVIQDLDRGR